MLNSGTINWTRYLQISAETSACFDVSAASNGCWRSRFFTSWNSFALSFWFDDRKAFISLSSLVTSSDIEELHEAGSSTVDCASDTDDNRITGRQITTDTKPRLYDLDMLLNLRCYITQLITSASWLSTMTRRAGNARMAC